MMAKLTNAQEYYAWVKEHAEQIKADAENDNPDAKAIVATYNMLVRHADNPTLGVFMGCVDGYIRRAALEGKGE